MSSYLDTPPPPSESTNQSTMTNLANLSQDFHVNSNGKISEVLNFPTSEIFYRKFVSKSVPLKITRGLTSRQPCNYQSSGGEEEVISFSPKLSSLEDISSLLGEEFITVNVTPGGFGDALIVDEENDELVFVTPEERRMTFKELVENFRDGKDDIVNSDDGNTIPIKYPDPVFYYSQQDNNLQDFCEVQRLSELLPKTLPFAENAFATGKPQAINFWVGDGRATTTMHRDVFENMYVVLKGIKVFILVPPYLGGCLYEDSFRKGSWKQNEKSNKFEIVYEDDKDLEEDKVKWVSVDVENDIHKTEKYPMLKHVKPIRVEVCEGETLYLPAMWYHKVYSVGTTIAVNYWYDMEYDGLNWMFHNFACGVGEEECKRKEENTKL